MLSNVVTDVQLFNLPVRREPNHHVLKELVQVVLQLVFCQSAGRRVTGVLVAVQHDHCLGEIGLDVFSGAAVSMATGADLEIEGAVDLVLFRAIDRCQVVCAL